MSENDEEDKLKKYLDAGITKLSVHYAGGGDDGCIEEVEVEEGDGVLTPEMKDEIETFVYEVLQDFPDWYNNEGGYGNIYINVKKDRMEINHNVYYENSETDALGYDTPVSENEKKLNELLRSLPKNVTKVLCNIQREEEIVLRFIDKSGRRIKDLDENLVQEISDLFDELCDSALWDSEQYEEDMWYDYEVVFDCEKQEFESDGLRYTVRTEEGSCSVLKFSDGSSYEGEDGHDD